MGRTLLLLAIVACGTKAADKQQAPKPAPGDAAVAAVTPDAATAKQVEPPPDPTPVRKVYVDKIPDAATFEAYSKEVGGERFAKFVLDLKTDAIYYFDVNIFPVHKDFIFGALYKKPKTPAAVHLVDRNYHEVKPDFMMVYLVHHETVDQWTFAYWAGDRATSEHVKRAYKRIKETFYLADKVRFRPDSDYQEHIAKQTPDVPYVLNDQLYKLADYVAFNPGVAVGTLRIVPPEIPETDLVFATDDIVVLKTPLSDITPVAGIISETFSTPLSHVSLRAKGWKIPNIGLKNAARALAPLNGKVVYFEAKAPSHLIREATPAEIADAKARAEAAVAVTLPVADLKSDELTTLDDMREKDAVRFGYKAANLGEIKHAKLADFEVPPGFGIPFHFYQDHLAAAGIDKQLAAMFKDPAIAKDANLRKTKLEEIRKAIETAPFSAALRAKVQEALAALPENNGVFVRSSTNAEDLQTFNGAGLHDTLPNVKGVDAVCNAIRIVWASTWTLRAYDARLHAKIDQTKVYGGILVQIGIPATAAGVVATVHPSDPDDKKYYSVNAKSGLGMSVVDGGKVPESLIVSWYNRSIRVLSRSDEDKRLVFDETGGVREEPNPNKGKRVLSDKNAVLLAQVAKQLTKLFKNDKLDIEWVFVGDTLYIVQTRPLMQ